MKLPSIAKKQTLKRKLFIYMCVLASILCALLLACSFLIGSFTGTKQRLCKTLTFQSEVFEKQIDTYYDNLAVMSIQLSQGTTTLLENFLEESSISFSDLNDSEAHISSLQDTLIEPLRRKLWEADCSGAFIMLDAHVNSNIYGAELSRTGIYLQRNSLEMTDTRVLLYRGLSDVGKEHECMPHRKWRLEFNTDFFPNYNELRSKAALPLDQSYRITDVVVLPGTDQHVMLMTIPILSSSGEFYGFCGFEMNEGYFKQIFAQPSETERAVFCLSKSSDEPALSEKTLSAGVLNEYYLEPSGNFSPKSFGSGLVEYVGEDTSYVGITKQMKLCPGECVSSVSVLIPMQDYVNMSRGDTVRIVFLITVFAIAAVALALLFTQKYLKPLKRGLEQIRNKEYSGGTAYAAEISDLFEFLAEQDRINEAELERIKREKADALSEVGEIKTKYNEAARQNERLAYSRKDEIDPYDYENFKAGLKTLTEKETEIFSLYLSGKSAKEITELLGIKESTLKFHNHNMLSKLGVSSRKQMLRYAALAEHEITHDVEPETYADSSACP